MTSPEIWVLFFQTQYSIIWRSLVQILTNISGGCMTECGVSSFVSKLFSPIWSIVGNFTVGKSAARHCGKVVWPETKTTSDFTPHQHIYCRFRLLKGPFGDRWSCLPEGDDWTLSWSQAEMGFERRNRRVFENCAHRQILCSNWGYSH